MRLRLGERRCRLWIADSAAVADFLVRDPRLPRRRIVTWPLFERTRFDQPMQRWDGCSLLQIESVGRLQPQKNYGLPVGAIAVLLARYPELAGRIRVTITGEGPERAKLGQLVAARGLASIVALHGAGGSGA